MNKKSKSESDPKSNSNSEFTSDTLPSRGPLSKNPERRCTAHLTDGSGRRCKKPAISGTNVCRSHGGGARQVREAAAARLFTLVDPAIRALDRAMKSEDVHAIIKAAQVVLDRNGFHPTQGVEFFGKDGGPVEIETTATIDPDSLSPEAREILWKEVQKARALGQLPEGGSE